MSAEEEKGAEKRRNGEGRGRQGRRAGEGDPRAGSYRLHSCDGHSFLGHWKILND